MKTERADTLFMASDVSYVLILSLLRSQYVNIKRNRKLKHIDNQNKTTEKE